MNRVQYHDFMQDQIKEIKKYRKYITDLLGVDLGDILHLIWISKYAKEYRTEWIENNIIS